MRRYVIIGLAALVFFMSSCGKKNPPRDEIPLIKGRLGELQVALRERNAEHIDSMLSPIGRELGYSGTEILTLVYPDEDATFLGLSRKEFSYTADRAVVTCYILANSADSGRAVELLLEKRHDRWFVRRFDLK
ncbi:MAG: hypothetical protein JSV44_12415 [Candidatus Zixiibacteriota bacterium]|nr:MAG: hypothetical protein JSV44_12415 [candidate division Zixibacteria bacterium]